MDLTELSQRTAIDRRKLRYVVDHELVPRLHFEIVDDAVGRPRHFAEDVGFAIACAAQLLDIGLGHATIRLFLEGLLNIKLNGAKNEQALPYVLKRNRLAVAQLGDGQLVRLSCDGFDSGWIAPRHPHKIHKSFVPITTVTLDIGRIRQIVFSAD